MNIPQTVLEVEEVFLTLDNEIAEFKQWSGLHCKLGCGKCCYKPDIEATVLEFLPFAYHLYKDGKAIQWLENPNLNQPICVILNAASTGIGQCSSYQTRGLICRLFGFSARLNKYGKRELVSCQTIKLEQAMEYSGAASMISEGTAIVPLMHNYYMRLRAVDSDLARQFYPINIAIRKAIELVLHHFSYLEYQPVTI